jgi:O-antigen/teichoic acid export membrane protein
VTDEAREGDAGLIRRGAAWKIASELFTQASRLVFAFLLARLLTPREYGLAGMALVVSGFVLVFSDLALGAALIQRQRISERDRSTMFWVSVASGVAFTLIGVASAGLAATVFDQPNVQELFAAMSLVFVITSLGATQAALLTRAMDFRALELRMMIGTVVGGVVGVGVALAGGGAWAIVAQSLTFAVISTVLLWLTTPWRPRLVFSLESLRNLGGYSIHLLGNRFLYILQETSAPVLIGRFLGAVPLGLYTVANNIVLTPVSRVTIPLGEVLFPAFSRLQENRDRIAELWLQALTYSAAVTLPALAGLVVVAPDFVSVVLGSRWEEAVPVIQILVWVAALRAVQGPATSVVLAINRPDALFRISIVALVAFVLGILVGLPWGIVGVALGVAVTGTGVSAFWLSFVARQVGSSLRQVLRALAGVIEASALMAAGVFGLRELLVSAGVGAPARLALAVVAGVVLYAAACRWRAPAVYRRLVELVRRGLRRPQQPHADSQSASEVRP